jgi:hypothetical protein
MDLDLTQYEKTNVSGILKNKKNGTIINMNLDQYTAYKSGKERAKELHNLKATVGNMAMELAQIKAALGLKT